MKVLDHRGRRLRFVLYLVDVGARQAKAADAEDDHNQPGQQEHHQHPGDAGVAPTGAGDAVLVHAVRTDATTRGVLRADAMLVPALAVDIVFAFKVGTLRVVHEQIVGRTLTATVDAQTELDRVAVDIFVARGGRRRRRSDQLCKNGKKCGQLNHRPKRFLLSPSSPLATTTILHLLKRLVVVIDGRDIN